MANKSKKETKQSISEKEYFPIEGRHAPVTYKGTRGYLAQDTDVISDLFSALRKEDDGEEGGDLQENSNVTDIIIDAPMPKKIPGVSEVDLAYFFLAIQQKLYNTSYLYGNEDVNSGMARIASKLSKIVGRTVYSGLIDVTPNELCYLMGIENPQYSEWLSKKNLLDFLDRREIKVYYTVPSKRVGDKIEPEKKGTWTSWLVKILEKDHEEESQTSNSSNEPGKDVVEDNRNMGTGNTSYRIFVSPVFTLGINRNFVELKQDTVLNYVKRLRANGLRRDFASIQLLKLVCRKDRRKPFTVAVQTILKETHLTEAFKKNKKRVKEKLNKLYKCLEEVELITGEPTTVLLGDGYEALSFTPNPDYPRDSKEVGLEEAKSLLRTVKRSNKKGRKKEKE